MAARTVDRPGRPVRDPAGRPGAAGRDRAGARDRRRGAVACRCDRSSGRSRRRCARLGRRPRARDLGRRPWPTAATRRLDVDLVVFGDRTPNLDLVLAAGAARRPAWRRPRRRARSVRSDDRRVAVRGRIGGRSADLDGPRRSARATGRHAARLAARSARSTCRYRSGPRRPGRRTRMATHSHPSGRVARGAIVCFCEDVRAWEIRAELAAGYADPELVKRRTGALTGPCQGKYCLQAFACLAGATDARPIPARRATAAPPDPPRRPRRAPSRRPGAADGTFGRRQRCSTPVPADRAPRSSSSAPGSPASPSRASSRHAGVRDVVIVERGYPGGGATGRNVARIRAMQLTEELTHVARRLPGEVRPDGRGARVQRPVLPARLRVGPVRGRRGRADARDRRDAPPDRGRAAGSCRPTTRSGACRSSAAAIRSPARSSTTTRSSTTMRSSGRISSTWPGRPSGSCRARRSGRSTAAMRGVEAVETDRGRIPTRAVLNATDGWSTRAQRPGRRLGAESTAPTRGPRDRAAPPDDRGRRHVLPPDRGLVQPDPPRRDRHGRRRPGRAGRRRTSARRGTSCAGRRRS